MTTVRSADSGATKPATELAELITLRLEESRQSRRWLAREIGVSPQTVNNLLKGQRPDVATLEKLGPFLHQPLPALLRMAGFACSSRAERGHHASASDWSAAELARLVRDLPPAEKKRIVLLVQLHLGVEP